MKKVLEKQETDEITAKGKRIWAEEHRWTHEETPLSKTHKREVKDGYVGKFMSVGEKLYLMGSISLSPGQCGLGD